MIRRRMVVGEVAIARRAARRAPPSPQVERTMPRWPDAAASFPRPSFNKGAKPLREDFARAGNGSTAKLAHMQDQLHLATSARHICHQAGKVNSRRGWPPEYTADRGGFSLSPSYGG